MSVKVREKRGKLYLDIYQAGTRTWEALHLELTDDKVQNKEIRRLAEVCRSKRETQLLTGAWDINDPVTGKMLLIKYLEDYGKTWVKPSPILGLIKYLKQYPNGSVIRLIQITPKWVESFQDFLLTQKALSRYTVSFYLRTLRSGLNRAVQKGMITRNPAASVQKITAPEPEMEFLSFEELKSLAAVTLDHPYGAEVRRAFLFGCYTGLRVSDIETLTWGKIGLNPMQIIKRQEKTKVNVYIPLNKSAQSLIEDGKKHSVDEKVFNISNHNRRASYSHFKKWAEKAGLKKTIGWHTARRTFATMALENGVDIQTVAKLLGQIGLGNVTKYAKVTDKLKIEAVNALPSIVA